MTMPTRNLNFVTEPERIIAVIENPDQLVVSGELVNSLRICQDFTIQDVDFNSAQKMLSDQGAYLGK